MVDLAHRTIIKHDLILRKAKRRYKYYDMIKINPVATLTRSYVKSSVPSPKLIGLMRRINIRIREGF